MDTKPYWSETAEVPKFLPLRRDLEVDVTVIGGGIMGITAAYLLTKAGAKVALIERDRLCGGETAHTTAHLTYVTDTRLRELVKTFGRDHAQAAWDAGLAAIERIHHIVEDEELACDFHWVPGYLHAPAEQDDPAEEVAALREDAQLAAELGFDAEFLDRVPFVGRPGVRFANQAVIHPSKYLAGLTEVLQRSGCELFENTEAGEIEVDPPRVKANGHTIHCRLIVIATHVPLQGAVGTVSAALFQTKLAAYSTYAVGAKLEKGVAPRASFWDTANPYFYLRIDQHEDHDYGILGGADHKTGQTHDPEAHYCRVEERLRQMLPAAQIDHHWSGQVIETNDGLPFIGETAPGQFVATGFAGNGITFGTLAAMMATDLFVHRKNPWSELFDVHRKKVLGGTWNYLLENKDYPFYMAKEWLKRPDAVSLHSVPKGEGRIVILGGSKVAAYRDDEGKLSAKSAVCPHLGCIVRWNAAEKTWDCPCHGSRFRATGEVMAGPAESPLAEIDEPAAANS
jgi:glycine/D-amino acid oxidase-like deaminating enzyme/nitrite reductase/ring-hydroxylating ferredoxin subunit